MEYKKEHGFELSREEMERVQDGLRGRLCAEASDLKPKTVCGIDAAYFEDRCVAVAVAMDCETLEIKERVWHEDEPALEYVPGLLAFRELPAILGAWEKLQTDPDLVFFDGNGMLHPKRMGIASHASFFLGKPTIGVAKTPFIGKWKEPAPEKGAHEPVYDGEEAVGAILRTRQSVKPVFVSVGNGLSLEQAISFSLHFCRGESRVPEIVRAADSYTKEMRTAILSGAAK